MDLNRYSQLYDISKVSELNHDEQLELIQLSTQILYKLMDSHRAVENTIMCLHKTKTLDIKL